MDGGNIVIQTGPRAQVMRRTELVFNTWSHHMDAEIDWRAALNKDYWFNVAAKLRPGDKIEVHSHNHAVAFWLYVIDINTASDPTFWDVAYLPIYPRDLDLPQPEAQVPPRYAVREAIGGGLYRVVDLETGMRVHDNDKTLHSAQELCSEMNKALAVTTGQIADALSRVQAATDPEPTRSPGAERTAAYRARKRAEAEAAATQQGDAAA